MDDCLFCRIVGGSIPSTTVYKDDRATAFRDIEPQAPVHVLIVPNEHIGATNTLEESHEAAVGHLLRVARAVAEQEGVSKSGFRLIVNTGQHAMMSVPHLHVHLLGGRQLGWPPG
ncbi:MAG: histidine triad nucleotide-binding protein [Chloroflexota bacterium]